MNIPNLDTRLGENQLCPRNQNAEQRNGGHKSSHSHIKRIAAPQLLIHIRCWPRQNKYSFHPKPKRNIWFSSALANSPSFVRIARKLLNLFTSSQALSSASILGGDCVSKHSTGHARTHVRARCCTHTHGAQTCDIIPINGWTICVRTQKMRIAEKVYGQKSAPIIIVCPATNE